MSKYNWGVVGTGWIATDMTVALNNINGSVYGVCSKQYENAVEFQNKYGVKHVFEDLDKMLEDDNIHIIYIATPHNMHYEMMKKSLLSNKHVFCEKAITINDTQLLECVEIAKQNNLVIMDGVTLFHMPLYAKIKQMIQSGIIGDIKMIQVNFGSCKEYDVNNRFFSKELAGGALLDIGVYAVSFARYFMKSHPSDILTTVSLFETGVDESSAIILKNKENEIANISLTMRAKQPKRGLIAGELGFIEVEDFPRANTATITYTNSGKKEEITVGDTALALEYEIEAMESYVSTLGGKDNLNNIIDVTKILTDIRKQWNLKYPFE